MNSKLFYPQTQSLLFIPNHFYFEFIKYLPKGTIILIPKEYIKLLINYEYKDYYIFTVEENFFFLTAMNRIENNYHLVKIGKNYNDLNSVFISISITISFCLLGYIVYTFRLKFIDSYDILPIQKFSRKIPVFLCILNFSIIYWLKLFISYTI